MLQPELQRNSENLTGDGGIIKLGLKTFPQRQKVNWRKGVNAKIRYTAHAFITPPSEKSKDNQDGQCGSDCHDHDHNHNHKHDHKHNHKHSHGCCDTLEDKMKRLDVLKDLVEKGSKKSKKAPEKIKDEDLDPSQKPVRTLISDSTKNDPINPFELRIGYNFSVTAMEISVKSLKVGEKARFLCMPQYCDGFAQLETVMRQEKMNRDLRDAGKVPLNFSGCSAHMSEDYVTLTKGLEESIGVPMEFEIELVSIEEPGSFKREPWEMSPIERYNEIPQTKQEGGQLYNAGDFEKSLDKYERCLVLLEALDSCELVLDLRREENIKKKGKVPESTTLNVDGIQLEIIDKWTIQCRLNYAACKMKLGDYPSVIIQCSHVLTLEPQCIKALFRRGQAYMELGRDLELARQDFDALRPLCPENTPEGRELQLQCRKLDLKFKKHAEKEKSMFAGKLF